MASLVRLLVLVLTVSALFAQLGAEGGRRRGRGQGRRGRPNMQQLLIAMKEAGCLPEDFSPPDFSACQGLNKSEKLQCYATSAGFSGDEGYDEKAAKAFVKERSNDTEWRESQKELQKICASSLPFRDLPKQQQGAFVMTCASLLTGSDCARQRLAAALQRAVEEDDPEDALSGKRIAERLADIVEADCFRSDLKRSEELEEHWNTCAEKEQLHAKTMKRAFLHYMKFRKGNTIPRDLVSTEVDAIGEALAAHAKMTICYAKASEEIGSNKKLDYERMRENIDGEEGSLGDYDNAEDKDNLKEAAKEIISICESMEEFYEFQECSIRLQGHACAAHKAYTMVSGDRGDDDE